MSKFARRALFALFLLGTGGYALVQLRGPEGIPDLIEKREKIKTLRKQVEDRQAENARLEKKIRDLEKKDQLDIEQRLIDRLPEGEIQFRVEEPKVPATGSK